MTAGAAARKIHSICQRKCKWMKCDMCVSVSEEGWKLFQERWQNSVNAFSQVAWNVITIVDCRVLTIDFVKILRVLKFMDVWKWRVEMTKKIGIKFLNLKKSIKFCKNLKIYISLNLKNAQSLFKLLEILLLSTFHTTFMMCEHQAIYVLIYWLLLNYSHLLKASKSFKFTFFLEESKLHFVMKKQFICILRAAVKCQC